MKPHLLYLGYVIRHKFFVLKAGWRTGAPLWRLLIHDWSKFSRAEWGPYVHNFYGWSNGGPHPDVKEAFDRAWLHHQKRNPHHWQYWVLHEDGGTLKALPIPDPFLREMVADWMGAGRAITGRWEVEKWYWGRPMAQGARDRMTLHPETQVKVEKLIEEMTG